MRGQWHWGGGMVWRVQGWFAVLVEALGTQGWLSQVALPLTSVLASL